MAKEYNIQTLGQPNYYTSQLRNYSVVFALPDNVEEKGSVNGIVLFIAGFGGHSESNVYKKMRNLFADKYNLVTVQCDYFGYEYMQIDLFEENDDSFCDMGPIQAMDNLIALKCVKDYLEEKKISYDNNVIAYGHSHGAYLAYLMNALMPNVLTCVIDNSAWLFPQYIDKNRFLRKECDGTVGILQFDYLLKKIIFDRDIYNLQVMYKLFDNSTRIITFHGTADDLVSINDKLTFIADTKNTSIEVIGSARIDDIFKSNGHGLEADFLKMFDYVMEHYKTNTDKAALSFENRMFETKYAKYSIDNSDGIPVLYCTLKQQ